MSEEALVAAQGGNGDKDFDNADDSKSSTENVYQDVADEAQMDDGHNA